MQVHVITCVGVDYDLPLLGHFIKHYANRGMDQLHVIVQTNVDGDLTTAIKQVHDAHGTVTEWRGEFTAGAKRGYMNREVMEYGSPGDVFCVVDVDEFAELDDIEAAFKPPVVYGRMIDRFANRKGELGTVLPEMNIFDQFPIAARNFSVNHCGMRAPFKAFLQGYEPYRGIHQYKGLPYKRWCKTNEPIKLHHFKWTEGRIEKSTRRMELHKACGSSAWRRSHRVLKAIKR